MKLDCDVIRDLLPLYHDRVCSEKTAQLVQEHLLTCEDCREYLQELDEELNLGAPAEEMKPLQDVGKRIRRMKWLAFGLGLGAAAVIISLGWAAAARYSEFIGYLLGLLRQGMVLLIPLMAILVPGVLVIRKRYQRKEKAFSWGKAVCWLLLLGWMTVYLYASLLHGGYAARLWNLQPFLMLREALNRFTPQLILNLFLNIGIFLPFGVLLPLLFEKQKKWYWALLTAVGTAAGIELMQFVTARGICDIDDVILDTLGAMLGWSTAMLVLSLRNGEKARSLKYLALPLGTVLGFGIIFGAYYLQPYGNFPDAPAKWVDCSQITWEQTEEFDTSSGKYAPVYQVGRITREESERFALDFAGRQGIEFNDVMYYDTMIIYADRSGNGGFLNVYYQDGSWNYSPGSLADREYGDLQKEQERLLTYLRSLGIEIPDTAQVTVENNQSQAPMVRVRIDRDHDGENLRHGEILCQFIKIGDSCQLMDVRNKVFTLEPADHAFIMGEQLAFEEMMKGRSFWGRNYDGQALHLQVSPPELDWQTDTKGFFQPVYRFQVKDLDSGAEFADFVPAIP